VNRRRMSALHNRAHGDLHDFFKCKLQNPNFRAAYDTEDKRIKRLLQTFSLRRDLARSVTDA
jgi:hypothetical protein